MTAKGIFWAIVFSCALSLPGPAAGMERTVTIGIAEGDIQGQALVNTICAVINRESPEHGILCSAVPNKDAVENLLALQTGNQDLAVVGSNWQYTAYSGTGHFQDQEDGTFSELRAIFSAETQGLAIAVRRDSGISATGQLKGRRLNIGNPGSRQRVLMDALLTANGWTQADFPETLELNASDQIAALCDRTVDAAAFAVNHPDPFVREALDACAMQILAVNQETVEAVVGNHGYLTKGAIPAGAYRDHDEAIATFSLRSTLVATEAADADLVHDVVRIIFENFDGLAELMPNLSNLDKDEMTEMGLTAPLHPGAKRYYQDKIW